MPRPRDNRCRVCKNDLPDEGARSERTQGTDICDRCAEVKMAGLIKQRAVRLWILEWRERLRRLLHNP